MTSYKSRPWGLAMLSLAALAPFFFLSYNFANWLTSLRAHVPSLVFGWERAIPFLAWTIVPYWSLDLLYGLSLFVCRARKELRTHVLRLVSAQLVCITGFLLFPLRLTFDRPHPAGPFGWMFDSLVSFDKPFNEAPSLHLCLTVILWAKYSQHLRGWPLWLLRAWFVVVGLSTLTTHQHHFIDLPTGIWAGLFCLTLFPDNAPAPRPASRDSRTAKLSAAYAAGSLLMIAAAAWIGGVAWWLLWPAGSLAIVAAAYATGRPELLRKVDGRMQPAMICLLAPYIATAWLSSRWFTRRHPEPREIADGVWLGRLPRKSERDAQAIYSMVDLTAELPVNTRGVVYRGIPMLDLIVPSAERLAAAVAAIDDLEKYRPTLVNCALGYSRSASAVAAWLAASGRAESVNEAIEMISARGARIVLGPAHRRRIEEWVAEQRPREREERDGNNTREQYGLRL